MAMQTAIDARALAIGYDVYRRNASMGQEKLGDKIFTEVKRKGFPYMVAVAVAADILRQEVPSSLR